MLDFLIIGAQKAGTTSLFQYLRQHPEIHMPEAKEEPFFSHDFPSIPHRSWSEYMASVFSSPPHGAVLGTATPQYMAGSLLTPGISASLPAEPNPERLIPLRIRETLPDVRLIAILREPVERAISAHRMMTAILAEERPFEQAITDLLEPTALQRDRHVPEVINTYVTFGEYGRILQGYYDVFPREQMLVVYTADLESDPGGVIRAICEHIGVDSEFLPADVGTRYLALGGSGRFSWLQPRAWERSASRSNVLRAVWHKFPRRGRQAVLDRYWSVSHRLFVWNATERSGRGSGAPAPTVAMRKLALHYRDDRQRLRALTGRDPPWAAGAAGNEEPRRDRPTALPLSQT